MFSGLFGKLSKAEPDEKAHYYTSMSAQRVQSVIQFKRGYKHLFYCKQSLLDCCMNLDDVVYTILKLLIEMTNSTYTKEFSLVSTLGEQMDLGGSKRDGELSSAIFVNPFGVYIDHNNHLFVLEGHSIRLVELNSEKKLVHTIAGDETQGTRDGTGEESRFMLPVFMSQDPNGDYLVLESHGHQIRKISFNHGRLGKEITPQKLECTVSTAFKFARDDRDLSYPHWIGYNQDMKLVCTDTVHNDICQINMEKRKRKSFIKNSESIPFHYPAGCCFNSAGDLFICDYHNHCIKKVPFSKKGEKQKETEMFTVLKKVINRKKPKCLQVQVSWQGVRTESVKRHSFGIQTLSYWMWMNI
jgi:hypothetical protein